MNHLFICILLLNAISFSKTILVVRPDGFEYSQAEQGLRSELSSYKYHTLVSSNFHSQKQLHNAIDSVSPDFIVVMDNHNLNKLIELSTKEVDFSQHPVFSILSLNLKNEIQNRPHFYGIEVEVPAYTLFTQFRKVSQSTVSKIGVFHQKELSARITEAQKALKQEEIDLVSFCLDCKTPLSNRVLLQTLKKEYREMIFTDEIDAIWMIEDNLSLNQTTLEHFWTRTVKNSSIPILTPFTSYTNPDINLGHFSAQAKYYELGTQVGLQIELYTEEGKLDTQTEPPISVNTSINLPKLENINWKLKKKRVERIKQIFE